MKKYILRNTLILLSVLLSVSSCKKDLVPAGGTNVEKMAGDWYVKVNNGTGFYLTIYTFNTADNSSTAMWLQANGLTDNNIHVKTDAAVPGLPIGVKGKVNVDLGGQTFSGANITNENTNAAVKTFSIANGKIITNGTTGPASKTPSDAISFDLIVNGVTYKVSGYHKTGFLEDIPPRG